MINELHVKISIIFQVYDDRSLVFTTFTLVLILLFGFLSFQNVEFFAEECIVVGLEIVVRAFNRFLRRFRLTDYAHGQMITVLELNRIHFEIWQVC